MEDTDVPPRRANADEAEATADEASMRLALERLGTRSNPAPHAAGGRPAAAGIRATPRPLPRPRFVRDGDVPVERVPPAARGPGEAGRELAEARVARLRADGALADAQGTIDRLQAARARAEQALQAAMVGLRVACIVNQAASRTSYYMTGVPRA